MNEEWKINKLFVIDMSECLHWDWVISQYYRLLSFYICISKFSYLHIAVHRFHGWIKKKTITASEIDPK